MYSSAFISTYYSGFLTNFYEKHPYLLKAPYYLQLQMLYSELFGDCDYYSRGLEHAGWKTFDIIMNCAPLNRAWAGENDFRGSDIEIVIEQIRQIKPHVLYIHDLNVCSREFLTAIRPFTKLIVGQIATVITSDIPFSEFDLIFSSFPHYVKRFRDAGHTAYYQPLAFDARILDHTDDGAYLQRTIDCSFVGGISQLHVESYKLLEFIPRSIKY